MPAHAFIAFGLFLKIPGYASVMLRQRRKAQCILKLLLGATSKEENEASEFSLGLSTMPFESLRELLSDAVRHADTVRSSQLTEFMFEHGILTLLLAILSTLSHHPHKQKEPHFAYPLVPETTSFFASSSSSSSSSQASGADGSAGGGGGLAGATAASLLATGTSGTSGAAGDDKKNLYWAKGTGFGTGSTMQQWDAEKTQMQQRMEEEHVTCIFEVNLT